MEATRVGIRLAVGLAAVMMLLPAAGRADLAEDQFNFATGLLIREEFELAVEEFENLLERYPAMDQADLALFRMGESYWRLERGEQAQAAFARLLERFPDSEMTPRALYRLGQLLAGDEPAQAGAYYARLAREFPEHALAEAANYWSGEAWFNAGRYAEAAAMLEGLLEAHPAGDHVPNAVYTLGWSYLKQDDHAAAHRQFARFVATWPEHELADECRLRNGDALHALERYDEALEAYRPLLDGEGENRSHALLATAWVLFDAGRTEAAAEAFIRAAADGAESIAPQSLFNAGNAWVKLEQYERALAGFEALFTRFPEHELAANARYWQAQCLLRLGRHEAALERFAALAGTDDAPVARRAEIVFGHAEAAAALERHAEAAAIFMRYVERFPAEPMADHAAYAAALEFERADDLPAAVEAVEQLLSAYPDSELAPVGRFALAEYQFRLGRHAASLASLDAIEPGALPEGVRPDYYYKRGWAAFEAEQHDRARAAFAALLGAYPESALAAESAYMIGRSHESAGQTADALVAYRSSAEEYPETVFAVRARLAAAQLALAAGQHAEALADLDAVSPARVPADLRGFAALYRGESLAGLQRFDEAREAYLAVGDDDAALHARAQYGAAWADYRDGAFESAYARFSAAADLPGMTRTDEARFWAARALESADRPAEAAVAYADFSEAYPESDRADEARYRQAVSHAEAGDADAAMAQFGMLGEGDSRFADNALYDLAWLHLDAGRADEAESVFRTLVTRHPESDLVMDARMRLAVLAVDDARYADALEHLDILAEAADLPFADSVRYQRGWCLQALDRHAEAAEAFAALAAADPDGPLAVEARYRQGRALRRVGHEAEALAVLRTVTDGPFAERSIFQAAEAERSQGNAAEALALYQQGLERFPEGELAIPLRLGLGHTQLDAGAYADAIESYAAVAAATDTIEAARALIGSGHARLAMGQYRAAARDFLKVDIVYGYEELKPEALAMLARCYDALDDPERADRYRRELATRYPDHQPEE